MKKFLPFLFIFVLWFLFSSPYFLKHAVPFPSDYLVNNFSPWNAYSQFASPVKNSAMPDVITQMYPWKYYTIQSLKQGQIPFWNPYSLSGTWHLANSQTGVLSPFNILFFILPFVDGWSVFILLQPLLAGLFTYLYLRAIERSPVASLIGSVSFMFCGFMTVWMAYGTLGYAILFLPLAFYAIEKLVQTKNKWFLVLLALTVPVSFFSGHLQTSVYSLFAVFAYVLFFRKELGKQIIPVFVALISGVCISTLQLLPALQAFQLSPRSNTFSTNEIIPWQYLVTFFAPDFYGNPVTRNLWFGHYAEWNGYTGVVALYLSHIGICSRNKRVWFFIGLFLVSLLFAYDTPLIHGIIALHTPFFSSVAASRIIVFSSFALSVLSAYGLDLVLSQSHKKAVIIATSIFTSIIATYWLIVFVGQKVWHINEFAVAKQNLLLPTGLFIITLLLVLFVSKVKSKFFIILALCSLLVVTLFDMYRFSSKWVPFEPKSLVYPSVSATSLFQSIAKSNGRVLGGFGAEIGVYYGLQLVDGYDSFSISRYDEFLNFIQNGAYSQARGNYFSFPRNGKYTKDAIDLLGITTVFHKIADGRPDWEFHFWDYLDKGLTLERENDTYQVFHNSAALPRAFFVQQYVIKTQPQDILAMLFSATFDRRNSVILEKNIGTLSGTGTVSQYTFEPQKITMKTQSTGRSILFMSDVYAPGWQAYVDGKKTDILRADYAFRSIIVPAGAHTITIVYEPQVFIAGLIIAGIGGVLLFILLAKR